MRLQRHLHAAELCEGEPSHSFRHGALQAAAQRGLGEAALRTLGQIRSSAVLGLYMDPARHLASPPAKRLKPV